MEVQGWAVSTQEAKWKQIQCGHYSATALFLVMNLQVISIRCLQFPLFSLFISSLPPPPCFFILFALSILEVKTRTLYVLGKLFYHWDTYLVHFSLNTASWAFAYTITPKPLLIKISAPTFTSLKLMIYPILLLDTCPPSAPMRSFVSTSTLSVLYLCVGVGVFFFFGGGVTNQLQIKTQRLITLLLIMNAWS